MMGISRETFWNDLQKTRQKVVNAPVNGKGIKISVGELNGGRGKRLIENNYCCQKQGKSGTKTLKQDV